jgi:hypothetical protein
MDEQRMLLGTDIEDYSSRNRADQARLQLALVEAVERAAMETGLALPQWERQPQGDGEFAVLPPGVRRESVVGPFVEALALAMNDAQTAQLRMRVRLSIHEGPVRQGANGVPGDHAVAVGRLVGADPLREAMAACPEALLGVIVSQRVYEDCVGQGERGSPPRDRFKEVQVLAKKQKYTAYIHLPGHNVHALELPEPPATPVTQGPVFNVSGMGANVAHGDQTIRQKFAR